MSIYIAGGGAADRERPLLCERLQRKWKSAPSSLSAWVSSDRDPRCRRLCTKRLVAQYFTSCHCFVHYFLLDGFVWLISCSFLLFPASLLQVSCWMISHHSKAFPAIVLNHAMQWFIRSQNATVILWVGWSDFQRLRALVPFWRATLQSSCAAWAAAETPSKYKILSPYPSQSASGCKKIDFGKILWKGMEYRFVVDIRRGNTLPMNPGYIDILFWSMKWLALRPPQ